MTREETEKAIRVMREYVNGKVIEARNKWEIEECDWGIVPEPKWDWRECDYRVMKESKVRPYTFEELCEAVKKHGTMVRIGEGCAVYSIAFFDGLCLNLGSSGEYDSYRDFASNYSWLDDNSPCGVVEA